MAVAVKCDPSVYSIIMETPSMGLSAIYSLCGADTTQILAAIRAKGMQIVNVVRGNKASVHVRGRVSDIMELTAHESVDIL